MKAATLLLSLLLVALVSSASAASLPRRMLLGECEDNCQRENEIAWLNCVEETKPANPTTWMGGDAFALAEERCRQQNASALESCKAECKPITPPVDTKPPVDTEAPPDTSSGNACAKKCDNTFGKGTQQAAWCHVPKGC